MKKHACVVYMIVCFSFSIYAQETKNISFEDKNYFENTKTHVLKSDLPDGEYTVFRTSELNMLFCSGEILNKEKTGTWTWYNNSGLKLREVPYVNDLIEGKVLSYYPTGEISSKIQYSNGLREGQMIKWYNTGQVKLEAYFSSNQPSGTWKFYDKEGNIIKQEYY